MQYQMKIITKIGISSKKKIELHSFSNIGWTKAPFQATKKTEKERRNSSNKRRGNLVRSCPRVRQLRIRFGAFQRRRKWLTAESMRHIPQMLQFENWNPIENC